MKKLLSTTILSPVYDLFSNFALSVASKSANKEHGVFVIDCMDARLFARDELKGSFNTPSPYTPAGAIVTPQDTVLPENLLVAKNIFNMKDILIRAHSDCGAMGRLQSMLLGDTELSPHYLGLDKYRDLVQVRKANPNLPEDLSIMRDNLAMLSALETARNVMNVRLGNELGAATIADLVNKDELRVHIGFVDVSKPKDRFDPQSRYYVLGANRSLKPVESFVERIRQEDAPDLTASFLNGAEKRFSRRLFSDNSPMEAISR